MTWFLEKIISQLLAFVPAHLKNTYDFLTCLNQTFPEGVPEDAILFTVDVAYLYGNIPTNEATDSVITLIDKHKDCIDLCGLDLDNVENLLVHCLSNNLFRFGQRYFKQTNGIAMGSRVAPPIAIIFMDAVESMMLSSTDLRPSIYLRYIDDIFWDLDSRPPHS